ncbi:Protein ANTAGONIST OF LIKE HETEROCHROMATIN PROTEIN 1 [Frankliniella fusca]|uniref:Protein ANTAGONIST OF LIKE HETEROCHROMATIN PROTEIN 1 n=1 Tax=Frankliniella fusca TaxID=407009 RepID=A0AAE1HY64_9NEOP|nr:Protein ANTAGONIST OF LIKE HETEROCHROMATIN PROTEIN 1 [Frankliniella fusca]KAK3920417.1 Protein ANTAGONIST OF LIKE HETEROCHROMATIN PROTEIN 1 [Frankliniella fusca]KAK3926399.1 Protein ANTAGONIST OF LIKE HETEROCHROMATIN PROTEIN 1 [Frankliniella fusca]KAK3929366.1 Protein ANTAGONIST OF LIKE HETEROCHROMATIN PROTEIN 1 [Frankliniella fusca]
MENNRRKVLLALAINATDRFLKLYDDDSDSESEYEQNLVLMVGQSRLRLRGTPTKPVRNENYFDLTVPRYTDKQFREHFRLSRTSFVNLENWLGPHLQGNEDSRRPRIEVRKQLLSVLWLLATPDSFRSVADRFDMGKSILHDCFKRTIKCLSDEARTYIVWPTGHNLEETKRRFSCKTWKKFYAIVLQGICNADLVFTDCFAGYPGSVSDIRIFRNSDIWTAVQENPQNYFPGDEYIIGDKAYPVLTWCIPPFINRGVLTQDQKIFNTCLSSMRQVIERAFSLLKGRFRRLKYLDMKRIDLIPATIIACCVLHNVCLLGGEENYDDFIQEGEEARALERNGNNEPIQEIPHDPAGGVKRDHIMNIVLRERARVQHQN